MRSTFLIGCESGPYGVVYLTNTPSLIVNCTDPISAFPIRRNMMHMLKRVRERASGRMLSLRDMLADSYIRHLRDVRRYEYLEHTPEELLMGVRAMLDFIEHHPPETPRPISSLSLLCVISRRTRSPTTEMS